MEDIRKRRVIRGLTDIGMVEMKATGCWGLTRDGCDFLDQIEVLRELDHRNDDRPGAEAGGDQRTGAAAPPRSARRGDDSSAARARRKGTR